MNEEAPDTRGAPAGGFTRLGGFALLGGFVIHIVVNNVLKTFPPESPSLAELEAYLVQEASTWAVVHGLRYLAFVGIAIFAAALFTLTGRPWGSPSTGWGLVGLLGAAFLVINGSMTNGIETLVFMDFERLSADPGLFWAFFHLTRVLFTAEVVSWGMIIGGFSAAGWSSATLPRWLAAFGFVSAILCVSTGVFIVSIMTDGPAVLLADIAALSGLAWFLVTGILLAAGSRGRPEAMAAA